VGLGAFGSHSLKNILDEYVKTIYEKAVLYQMFHTLALFLIGVLYYLFKETSFFLAGREFFIGIFLFSGSLYVLAITDVRGLGVITPIEHLANDVKRAYVLLSQQWLDYMKHLKENYPFLFSLAMRTNPYDQNASSIIQSLMKP
jgi:uncharacterized membrane protein YgdD (TMEM256/DUF423 family)